MKTFKSIRIPLVISTFVVGVSLASLAFAKGFKRDGFLRMYHSHHNEYLEITYEKNGEPDTDALKKINYFMRSRDANDIKEMDLKLIRFLDHLQDHFHADVLEVICGYRSANFNNQLFENGRNVAKDSNHIKGIAADIHLDEIDERTLYKYAFNLKKGGVGYYANLNMVHVDLGRVHTWNEGSFKDRTDVGIFNKSANWQIRTNHFFYKEKEILKLSPQNISLDDLKKEYHIDWFYRGKWIELGKNNFEDKLIVQLFYNESHPQNLSVQADGIKLPYGKFRLKFFGKDGSWQYSNEFYLKRL